jgi:general secretion pathway protein E
MSAVPDTARRELLAALQRARAQVGAEGLAAALARELAVDVQAARHTVAAQLKVILDSDLPEANLQPRPDLLALPLCRQLQAVAVDTPDGVAFLLDDPWDMAVVQALAEAVQGMPRLIWSTPPRIQAAIEQLAEQLATNAAPPPASDLLTAPAEQAAAPVSATVRQISAGTLEATTSPVVRFVDERILQAWKAGASDIHFESRRDRLEVKFRLDGVLVGAGAIEGRQATDETLNRIKVLAQLDIAETRVPQDGRFRAAVLGREMDFRVSIMPSVFGEDAVLRLLDKAQLRAGGEGIDLARLGFDPANLTRIRALARAPHGMLLVTGPTGSGKTTTLYAVLSEINRGDEKIVTIEDPVEYELPGVLQIPVNEKKGLTFARGLRSILRHDPDKILVGEIRDPETAEIAVQAALTGHLVFTTVHANNVYDVVGRFLHMNVDLYGFVSALNGIVAQRLVRRVCPRCGGEARDAAALAVLKAAGFDTRETQLKAGRGCETCRGTGYLGRTAIAETVPVDDTLRELVSQKASGRRLREHVATLGIEPLRHAALAMVQRGETTLEEVDRVVGSSD